MTEIFLIRLEELQPSQLYISADKLAAITRGDVPATPEDLAPIPVRRLGSKIILTDGHTRALAAWRSGLTELRAVWDVDDLDWNAYEICVGWCTEAGIRTVADLNDRIVCTDDYEELWIKRCGAMHEELETRRRRESP
jgi:hypothetical protein